MDVVGYLTRDVGVISLEEIAYLGCDDVEILIKRLNRPCGIMTVGSGTDSVNITHDGYTVSIRADPNLKLRVFYLKHQERMSRGPTAGEIDLALVHSYRDQQKW
jgi:hypothetical protein